MKSAAGFNHGIEHRTPFHGKDVARPSKRRVRAKAEPVKP
jgi:hypothetical protein